MNMYLIIGAAALALIYFVYIMVKPEKEVEEDEEDQMIIDPVTGSKMTYEEAIKGKVFINPDENDGVSAVVDNSEEYDLENALITVKESISEELASKLDDNQIKIILQLQSAYMMTMPENTLDEANVDSVHEALDKMGNDVVTKSDIEKILLAEEIYLRKIGVLLGD